MITHDYNVSSIARRYYALKNGERISNKQAYNRWKMLRNPDLSILKRAIKEAYQEQIKEIK